MSTDDVGLNHKFKYKRHLSSFSSDMRLVSNVNATKGLLLLILFYLKYQITDFLRMIKKKKIANKQIHWKISSNDKKEYKYFAYQLYHILPQL